MTDHYAHQTSKRPQRSELRKMQERRQRHRLDRRRRIPTMTARAIVARSSGTGTWKGVSYSATVTSRKRPAAFRSSGGDDEEDNDSGRDSDSEARARRHVKKCRRSSSASPPSFLSSGRLRRRYGGWQHPSPPRAAERARDKKVVTFADPLLSAEWTRPRTLPWDVPFLFYSKSDEARFRKEFRLERRLRRRGGWESDAESDDGSETETESEDEGDDEGVVVVAPKMIAKDDSNRESPSKQRDIEGAPEDPNEVTESDDSNSSGSDKGEGDSLDSSDDEDLNVKAEEGQEGLSAEKCRRLTLSR